ncbi:YqgE/AlgH family protein [Ferruginibacter sp. HRS2-29]|uniref:YqgE/AlgH family protein n=1 Tax=Ferruginibacter sp. HRS2-29 TaxID=2487334 RepID=UPI0020CC09E4|nr:YqgE/AlgH family protein [Ferruginibacter sp. HRS2-29]MCP9750183.1 YqgE/AlgH family protein [Ferruginibacter sp. HRS2-29]
MKILESSPEMDDPIFNQAVLLITQEDASGAAGFIINKEHPRRLNDLIEFHHCKSWPLHFGGPVEDEKLFFIHRRPDLIEEGEPLGNDIYLGGNFKQAIRFINDNTLRENEIRLFVGYCGWDAGELEAEIKEGSWKNADRDINVFDKFPADER